MKNFLSRLWENSSFWGYFMELIIVIVGVTAAFWLNSWAEENKENQTRLEYFRELNEDISVDIKRLEYAIEFNLNKVKALERAIGLYADPETNSDSLVQYALMVGSYEFFNPRDITYRTMITSGDFRLVKDPDLKKGLVRLNILYDHIEDLQNNFLEALDQNYFPYLVDKVDYVERRPVDSEFVKSVKVKNYIVYAINDVSVHIAYYNAALEKAQETAALLKEKTK